MHFVVRHLLHFGVVRFGEQLFRFLDALGDLFPLAIFRDDLAQLRMRLRNLLVARRVVMHLGRRKFAVHIFVAGFDLLQFFVKRQVRHSKASRIPNFKMRKVKVEVERCKMDKPIKSGAPYGAEEESLIKRGKHLHIHLIKNSGIPLASQTVPVRRCLMKG